MLHFFDSHEALAAWVQAFGSILIIGATAWISGRQSREMREREKKSEKNLQKMVACSVEACMKALDTFLINFNKHRIKSEDALTAFLHAYVAEDFQVPMDYLGAVPLPPIGTSDLAKTVLDFRILVGTMKAKLDKVNNVYNADSSYAFCNNERTRVFNLHASILRLIDPGPDTETKLSSVAGRV